MQMQEENQFEDFMLDIESTGLEPGKHAITSFCFLPFKLDSDKIMQFGKPLTVRVSIPSHRRVDAKTTEFRESVGIDEAESVLERYTPRQVLDLVSEWLESFRCNPTIWCKPTKFDIAFFDSYYADAKLDTPWHHRDTIDVRSWCRGLNGVEKWGEVNDIAKGMMEVESPISNPLLNKPHSAIYDCYLQCFIIRAAILVAQVNGGEVVKL